MCTYTKTCIQDAFENSSGHRDLLLDVRFLDWVFEVGSCYKVSDEQQQECYSIFTPNFHFLAHLKQVFCEVCCQVFSMELESGLRQNL